jgi:putative nucleotidyltransferase with HDIG domain
MQNKRKFISFLLKISYTVWTLLLLVILAVIVERLYTYAEYIAIKTAETSVNKDLAYRSWVSSHGGVYVPVSKDTPPNPYLVHIKDRDFKAIGKEFTLMNPAYTLSQMMKQYSKLYGIKTHITSSKTLNPKNKADEWETLALDKVEQTRENYYELNKIDNREYLRLLRPLITKKSCLKCHAYQGYKIGDIRGGVSVSVPMESLYDDAFSSSLYVGSAFFIIWLVGVLAIFLFSKKLYKYIEEKELLYEEYIYGLVNVVEQRDSYTAGHSKRVAQYAQKIAKAMGYSEYDCHILHRAGMLHDIGKIAIPDAVFLKPSRLSNEEYKLIKEHVEISYDMLKGISIFDDIKEIVRDHHEHYDGSGYPRGLIGEDTPMLAQILSLADAFDAMTTDRIYKGRKSVQEALSEIAQLSAKQFHPKVAQVAIETLSDVHIDDSKDQSPKTLLEKERFSYFYKDLLTNVFNEEYLRTDINKIRECKVACWLSLKAFHRFNKVNGWHAGDKLLQELANIIKHDCGDTLHVYRFYGDNFLILLENTIEAEKIRKKVDLLLENYDVEYDFKVSSVSVMQGDVGSLEDVLEKLF